MDLQGVPGRLASTGPSHGGGLTGGRHTWWRVCHARHSRGVVEEVPAAERAEAKRAELRKLLKELFGSGHPPGGGSHKKKALQAKNQEA